MRVHNKSIIVTGAGNGIGEGIAKRLAEEGANVLVNDINTAGGQRVVAEITAAGGKAIGITCDVAREQDVNDAIASMLGYDRDELVALTMHEDLRVDRFVLLHSGKHGRLADYVAEDIATVSPETRVEPQRIEFTGKQQRGREAAEVAVQRRQRWLTALLVGQLKVHGRLNPLS